MAGEDRQAFRIGRLDRQHARRAASFARRQPDHLRQALRRQMLHHLRAEDAVERRVRQVASDRRTGRPSPPEVPCCGTEPRIPRSDRCRAPERRLRASSPEIRRARSRYPARRRGRRNTADRTRCPSGRTLPSRGIARRSGRNRTASRAVGRRTRARRRRQRRRWCSAALPDQPQFGVDQALVFAPDLLQSAQSRF